MDLHIDKKLMHRLFGLIAGAIVFAWLVLDTARATALFNRFWELIAPFVTGAAIAFIFNVPMRAIEKQLEGVRKQGLKRGLSIVLTILCLVLLIMFVFELLLPQIRLTLESLAATIPAFIDRTAQNLMVLMEENPDLGIWIQEAFHLQSLNWSNIIKDILAWLGENRREGQVICGFSMETKDMIENSRAKLVKKNVDMICANNLKQEGAGFGVDTNIITIITKEHTQELPLQSKQSVAHAILTKATKL